MIKQGSIVALKLDNETPTARVIYIDAMEITVRLFGKNRLIVVSSWVKALHQGKLILRHNSGILTLSKTVMVTELLSRKPGRLTRFFGRLQGFQYKHHNRAMYVTQESSGHPHMARRWCRRKKYTGTLYMDGFLITPNGFPVYIDHFNQLKETVCKK